MKRLGLVLMLAMALSVAHAGLVVAAGWANGTASPDATQTMARLVQREHVRVCGRELKADPRLKWAARWKATDLGYHGGPLSHSDASGRKVGQHLARIGVDWSRWSEILAYNTYPSSIAAEAAFRQFMASAPHRQAIQSCNYTRFGVASFRAGPRHYFAVEFTRP